MSQPRRDHLGEQSFKPAIPLLVGRIAVHFRYRLEARTPAGRGEISERRGERIDARPLAKGARAGDPFDAACAQCRAAESLQKGGGIGQRRAGGIPLQKHELDIMLPATLASTERPGKLIDRPRVGCQQPLHQCLRACLEIVWRSIRAVDMHGNRIDMRLRQHLGREHRRVDLDEPQLIEHVAQPRADPAAEFEDSPCRHAMRDFPRIVRGGALQPSVPPVSPLPPDRQAPGRAPV